MTLNMKFFYTTFFHSNENRCEQIADDFAIGFAQWFHNFYFIIITSLLVSIQTCAPQLNGLSGLYTTLLGPLISTS